MIQFNKYILLSLLVLLSFGSKAQRCATPDSDITLSEAQTENQSATIRAKITIPVVVHVVWKEDSENISDEQIKSQIEALNRDFQQLNDQSQITSDFRPLAANVGIEFCLAQTDPRGKPTSGITRTRTSYTNVWAQLGTTLNNPTPRRRIYYDILEGHDAWDTQKYLNIWVGKLGNGKAGYGTFPNATKPEDVDGVVVDPNFFGTTGSALLNSGFSLGRTAVHEVGHYLNLYHLWGNGASNFDCSGDDLVADTPQQEEAISGCPSSFIFQCGKKAMTMNFMNFVYDDCMSMFTEGQKQRMLAALSTYRQALTQSAACNPVATDELFLTQIILAPNPTTDYLNITLPVHITQCSYVIMDIAGRVLQSGNCEQSKNTIDISGFPIGYYQVGMNIENKIVVKPFIKTNY